MAKTLCKIKKLLKKDLNKYVKHVQAPEFVCEKCGRVANRKGLLCAPVRMSKLVESK
ncbi:MAG: hypothetical protein AAF456_05885 [Planctomycetota bacterium]